MQSDLQNQDYVTCDICAQQVRSAAEVCPNCDSKVPLSTTLNLFDMETAPRLKRRTLEEMASEFASTTKNTYWKWIQLVALSLVLAVAYGRFSSILSPDLLPTHLSDLSAGGRQAVVLSGRAFVGTRDEPLVGKKIYLCRKELISALQGDQALECLGAFGKITSKKTLRIFADFDFQTVRNKVMAYVENYALKSVETTISGKYEFDELADGDYCLFSELIHNPIVQSDKTPFQWSLWILPVNLNKEPRLIDFSKKPSVVLIPKHV